MCPGQVITNDSKDLAGSYEHVAEVDRAAAQVECASVQVDAPAEHVLTPGLFPPEDHEEESLAEHHNTVPHGPSAPIGGVSAVPSPQTGDLVSGADEQQGCGSTQCDTTCDDTGAGQEVVKFSTDETLFIFDWDDTLLPSSWLQRQGLRLDDGSKVTQEQKEQLDEVANTCSAILCAAKECGTVVLVTNAERGWIELSCQKFMPSLGPCLESVKAVSARTSFESRSASSPSEWKVHAFDSEIHRVYGHETVYGADCRKNVVSLGDSVHEREALLRVATPLPNCRSKSLKFVERPDISQICKQLSLVTSCFDRIVHHDGNLDLCIKCT